MKAQLIKKKTVAHQLQSSGNSAAKRAAACDISILRMRMRIHIAAYIQWPIITHPRNFNSIQAILYDFQISQKFGYVGPPCH